MHRKIKILLIFGIIFTLFANSSLATSSTVAQEDSLQTAIQLFNSGEFEKAVPVFETLLNNDPDNDMLNYYYGASLAEQGIFTDKTNESLLKAVSGNTPDKIFYYVGKYFQSKELWNSALKYYNRFKNYATEEEKQSVDIDKHIQLCYSQSNQGAVSVSDSVNRTEIAVDSVEAETAIENQNDKFSGNEIAAVATFPEASEEEIFEPIQFQVNSDIEYLKPEHFHNSEALELFNKGMDAEKQLRQVVAKSDSLRKIYSSSTTLRDSISEKILMLEQESYTLNSQAAEAFSQARNIEQEFWNQASAVEKSRFRQEITQLKQQLEKASQENREPIKNPGISELDPEIFVADKPIEAAKPKKPAADKITFRIQIGAYSRKLPDYVDRLYKKLSLIRDIDNYTDDRGVTVYTTGNLTNFDDAIRMQEQVRQEGVKDAFVVAYKNGERITIREAKEILNIQ